LWGRAASGTDHYRGASDMSDIRFEIPPGTPTAICKGCGEFIKWIRTKAGKNMPVNADGTSHFATCTKASDFRKKPQIVVAPAKFNPLLDDLKGVLDDLEQDNEQDCMFIQKLLIRREEKMLHQMSQAEFDWLDRLHSEYFA